MIDDVDRQILQALSKQARMSLKALAGTVGLSSPSAAERLRRLEEQGVIRGYGASVDAKLLGFTLEALIRIRPLPGRLQAVRQLIETSALVAECDSITGEDCFMTRVLARSMDELDGFVERLAQEATTNTSIVKKQIVERRVILS